MLIDTEYPGRPRPSAAPRGAIAVAALWFSVLPGVAQESASYRMTEHVFNAGGRPEQGVIAVSAGFRMSIDAIGDGLAGASLSSASFSMTPGFVGAYPPPGEVFNLRFTSDSTILWDPEASAGLYNVYRDEMASLPGPYGACYQLDLAAATANEPAIPSPGQAWFYLVTVENLLGEEGTKGLASSGLERVNPVPCP